MNAEESKALKEKLDGLMSAAEEFGNQSAQLSKVSGSFDAYAAAASKAEEKMQAVIDKCNEYIDSFHTLTEKDFSGQIDSILKDTGAAVQACKEQCERVSAEYKEALALFERQKPVFEAAQVKLAERTETGFADEAGLIRQTAESLEKKAASLAQELTDSVEQMKEELNLAITEQAGQILVEFVKVKQANDAIQAELTATKAELEAAKEWRIRNELLIKISLIAATLAAVASIVNLFV